MNQSEHTFDGGMSYPLKLERTDDGRIRVTSGMIAEHEWFGKDEVEALRTARRSIEQLHGERKVRFTPRWMTEEQSKKAV